MECTSIRSPSRGSLLIKRRKSIRSALASAGVATGDDEEVLAWGCGGAGTGLAVASHAFSQGRETAANRCGDLNPLLVGHPAQRHLTPVTRCRRELFFVSCFLFSLAAACRAFVWIAADSRHG